MKASTVCILMALVFLSQNMSPFQKTMFGLSFGIAGIYGLAIGI